MTEKPQTNSKLKSWKYWLVLVLSVSTIGILLIVGFWRPGILRGRPNSGHQLGGDLFDDLSGNTIECFEAGVEKYGSTDSWKYTECDIRETKDHHLIVFHDWNVAALKNTAENRTALGEHLSRQAIRDLTLEQIQSLRLNCGSGIPTLREILNKAAELQLKKPLLLEFKHLHSDDAREEFLNLAIEYRDKHDLDIHFLSFIMNVEICFPQSDRWMKRFSENEFRVYQVFRPKTEEYDMCRWWN